VASPFSNPSSSLKNSRFIVWFRTHESSVLVTIGLTFLTLWIWIAFLSTINEYMPWPLNLFILVATVMAEHRILRSIFQKLRENALCRIIQRGQWLEARFYCGYLLLRPHERVEQELGSFDARAVLRNVLLELELTRRLYEFDSMPDAVAIPIIAADPFSPTPDSPTMEQALWIRDCFAERVIAAVDARRIRPYVVATN